MWKLKTVCMVTNINIVVIVIEEDHNQSVPALAKKLKISWESIRQMLMDKLGMKQEELGR